MADQSQVHKGECRCGQVRFQVRGAPILTMACHCTGCQRMTASAFSLSSLYAFSAFEVMAGEPVIGGLRSATRHYFCPHCMSWLFTRPDGLDEFVNVRATMLEDARGFTPFIETYTSEALPWAKTPAVHSFEKFLPVERYGQLVEDFARSRAEQAKER